MEKEMTLGDLFTQAELDKARALYNENRQGLNQTLVEQVVAPAIDRINAKTGQENDARYFGYMLEHAFNMEARR